MASSSRQGSGHSIFAVSERSLVVRTLGINEVIPLSNFDGFFPPIFQNSCTTIVLGPPLLVGRRSNPGILPRDRLFETNKQGVSTTKKFIIYFSFAC